MHERIKQLADEAGFMDSWFSESGDDCERELKKFAELIVRQCMALCEDVTERNDPAIACYYEIKRHFLGEEL